MAEEPALAPLAFAEACAWLAALLPLPPPPKPPPLAEEPADEDDWATFWVRPALKPNRPPRLLPNWRLVLLALASDCA